MTHGPGHTVYEGFGCEDCHWESVMAQELTTMLTDERLRGIIDRVVPAPSCVDMGWEWEFRKIWVDTGGDCYVSGGYLIRCSFQRPDTNTGKIGRGFGRYFHLQVDETESGILKTMLLAMTRIVDHEVAEMFRLDGDRIFDPHFDVSDLRAAIAHRKE